MVLLACQQPSDPVVNRQTPARPSAEVDSRIVYQERQQPVFVAPDGSRHQIASLLAVKGKMRFGDFIWKDVTYATGPIWVRVDLPRQLISVFRGANEIGTAVIVYGSDGKATPAGTFPILGKERMHRSSSYDADMPYTLWLTHDGVAIHASTVEQGRVTHGCIGIPSGFAQKLFDVAARGDIAIVLPASGVVSPSGEEHLAGDGLS